MLVTSCRRNTGNARAYLITGATSKVAEGILDGTRRRVDVRLESGGVIVGRHDDCLFRLFDLNL